MKGQEGILGSGREQREEGSNRREQKGQDGTGRSGRSRIEQDGAGWSRKERG